MVASSIVRCYSNHCVPFTCNTNTLKQETELAHGRRSARNEETTAILLKAAAQFRVLATKAKQRRCAKEMFLIKFILFHLT